MNKSVYPSGRILLVDDDLSWLKILPITLERCAGITNVVTCSDSRQVTQFLDKGGIELVLLDLNMPNIVGEDLLKIISENYPEITTIVVSSIDHVATAVRCMKLGAFDYFIKTDEEDRIVGGILRAVRMMEMRSQLAEMSNTVIAGGLRNPEAFTEIVTGDRSMLALFAYIEAVAKSQQPLLITGESGTGKELLARATHALSGCQGKLIAVNVAGLDDTVFSDTLFGHVRGAFTGADTMRRGMVEEAEKGTLFLDEIGDLSIPSQVKLLRLLQEGEYFPLGSDSPKRLNARVIVATHQNLSVKEAGNAFRRDLYYRLRTHQVRLPPLRERKDDIPLLLNHFLVQASSAIGKKAPTPTRGLAQYLATYSFPGNIRELRAMVYDAVSVNTDRILTMAWFIKTIELSRVDAETTNIPDSKLNPFASFEEIPTISHAVEFLLDEAMKRSSNNQTLAARLLGISQPALNKRLKTLHS
ncbi:MAG: sigma-54-dependent Fis family transcriptional regulator [Geobacteraceae bacterium]|nr:sigma-54-dependent Fis family transcriptional regulator [Geobacteraceae bacterium]NTW79975.1 sigma-54-dependent Fis family transcriptional regulator [Geobacteraceae bacterium]